ncbi:hypothetical protein [Brachybacterium sacelli]|uniref:Uncharacterized protein n=1 Tax=Brachybacterium sacelli TaxID=173364 RepID=A0ABS4X430_9MICO|nr:hypothetical protein [Brachybacterium sacelli]MBP2383131.1 hypothetical protein [Brachybacterium sacelli]
MTEKGPDPAADGGTVRRGVPPRRVVISSVTGKPIPWEDQQETERETFPRERRPVLPNRVAEDAPEPGTDETNDSRIAGDVPPHWGRGR